MLITAARLNAFFALFAAVVATVQPLRAQGSSVDNKLISLAYWLVQKRDLNRETVRRAAQVVFGDRFSPENPQLGSMLYPWSSRKVSSWILRTEQGIFVLNSDDSPYMKEQSLQRIAESIEDPRLSQAVESHRAWISFDFLQGPESGESNAGPLSEVELYRYISRFLAELTGNDILAVYFPEMRVARLYDGEVLAGLRSENPLALFARPDFGPVITVRNDHPFMIEAVFDARRRLKEFVEAFRERKPDGTRFIVKAVFEDQGSYEAMWLYVEAIGNGLVKGKLANAPNAITNLEQGQEVTVPEGEVIDWMYRKDGQDIGGFTRTAVDRIQKFEPSSGGG